jgi:hypothetical protein
MAGLLAGCLGAGDPGAAPAARTETARVATTALSDSPDLCASRDLRARLGAIGAAAGTAFLQIRVRNTGTGPCALPNYPGLTLVTDSGRRLSIRRHYPVDHSRPLELQAGGWAHIAIAIASSGDVPEAACGSATIRGAVLSVAAVPIGATIDVRWPTCTRPAHRPQVTPFLPGRPPHAI